VSVILRLTFVLAVVIAAVVVYATSAELPARVATHFVRGGLANGWMTHDGYLTFMLPMSTLLPLGVAAALGFLPAAGRALLLKSSSINTREDLDKALPWLAGAGSLIGVLLCAFMVGVHFLVIDANQRSPARLDESTFATVLIAFLVLLFVCIGALGLRFGRLRR
jgi:uncharacterized membrane protein